LLQLSLDFCCDLAFALCPFPLSDRTLFKSVGSAIQDVATAFAVLQRARAQKAGQTAQWQ